MKPRVIRDPVMAIAGLEIWVHDRQFPELMDYWDGNWLSVTARCTAGGAVVEVRGPIIHLSEVSQLLGECEAMNKTLKGSASLACMEPYLRVNLEAKGHGHISITVEITPDHFSQWHKFVFEADQTYLPTIISGCKGLLKEYPIRREPNTCYKENG
jgi:hypothetical protein